MFHKFKLQCNDVAAYNSLVRLSCLFCTASEGYISLAESLRLPRLPLGQPSEHCQLVGLQLIMSWHANANEVTSFAGHYN